MDKNITPELIEEHLRSIGIRAGDCIFVTADLFKTGLFMKSRKHLLESWVQIFKKVLTNEGTLIVASYSKAYPFFAINKDNPFNHSTKTTSGALSLALLNDPESIRSSHPTNSYTGWGKHAKDILASHDHTSKCYDVTEKIINFSGKNLMLGTIDGKNAPMVFHYCQQVLGYTLKDPFSNLSGVFYEQGGSIKRFIRKDVGGCSSAGNKLYSYFIEKDCIDFGRVGAAQSCLIDCKKSFEVSLDLISKNSKFAICDDGSCISCYGRFSNSGFLIIPFYIKKLFKFIFKITKTA